MMMNNEIKIAIYLKNREKPIILTDGITPEDTYEDKVEFFHNLLSSEEKIFTVDFLKDNFIFNVKDIQSIVVSKPNVSHVDLRISDDDDTNIDDEGETDETKPLNLGRNEHEDNIDDLDADNDESESITIVEN